MTELLNSMKTMTTSLWQINSSMTEQKLQKMKATEAKEGESFKVSQTCREFESLFLNYLLKEMRATIPKSGLLDEGAAQQIYTSMFDEKLSQELAQHGGIGLAQIIQSSLMKGQNKG